jgi:hypothetical protein
LIEKGFEANLNGRNPPFHLDLKSGEKVVMQKPHGDWINAVDAL